MDSSHFPCVGRQPPPKFPSRYPSPDPSDPFAPLWVLRSRALSTAFEPPIANPRPLVFPTDLTKETLHYRRARAQSSPVASLSSVIKVADKCQKSTYQVFVSSGPFECSERPDVAVPPHGTDFVHESSALNETRPILAASHSFAPHAPTKRGKLQMIKTRSQSLADNLRLASPQRNSVGKQFDKRIISSPAHVQHLVAGNELQFSYSLLNAPDGAQITPVLSAPPPLARPGLSRETAVLHQHQSRTISHTTSSPFIDVLPNTRTASHSVPLPGSMKSTWKRSESEASDVSGSPSSSYHSPSTSSPRTKDDRSRSGFRNLSKLSPTMAIPQAEWSPPNPQALSNAASLPVITESGLRVPFGSLLTAERTVVIFIRHFWCPQCQDYMASLTSLAHPELMVTELTPPTEIKADGHMKVARQRVQLIVIGNGSHNMIAKYRRMFKMPFNMYTDPTLALHLILGMARLQGTPSVSPEDLKSGQPGQEKRVHDGGYQRHGAIGSFAAVVGRALKVGMPVWEDGGDKAQLGGEFIFGPGMTCTYAHRMQSIKGHVPAGDVLSAAGIDLPSLVRLREVPVGLSRSATMLSNTSRIFRGRRRKPTDVVPSPELAPEKEISKRRSMSLDGTVNSRSAFVIANDDEEEWMARRMRSLERLREKKNRRRGTFAGFPNDATVNSPYMRSRVCTPVEEAEEHIFIAGDEALAAIAQITLLGE